MRFIAITIAIFQTLARLFLFQVSVETDVCPKNEIIWTETATSNFAIIYPEGADLIGNSVYRVASIDLERSFARLIAFFETTIPVPVTIRIYPTENVYACFNPLAPELRERIFLTHVGAREIALIEEKIDFTQLAWQEQLLNALRHELAVLFVEQITDGKAPPGLISGVGAYAEDPDYVLGNRQTSGDASKSPSLSWRELWEYDDISQDRGTTIKSMSNVAFLIDVYQWPKFLEFLNNLSRSEGYRQAISDTYQLAFSDIEEQWRQYYPYFFEGRWRANVLYDFDLSVFEELIYAGAYSDAAVGLKEVIEFLESIQDTRKAEEALVLLDKAKLGELAGTIVSQSRQALQNKDYEKSINLAIQAEEIYISLDAQHRLDELDVYKSKAEEVLALQTELEHINNQIVGGESDPDIQRLKEIGVRLFELGDNESQSTINLIFENNVAQQEQEIESVKNTAIIAVLILFLVRFILTFIKPPKEAKLL